MSYPRRSANPSVAALLALLVMAALGLAGLRAASAAASELAPTCTGGDIVGAGTTLQEAAQYNVWLPGFSGEVCPSGPAVRYFGAEGNAGMENWRYHDGVPGAFNAGLKFIATDEAPTAAQLSNIKNAASGADVVVIPVAETAIAIPANPPAGCTVEKITNRDLEKVFRGVLADWSQLATAEGACESPITRVVRRDSAGTTSQLKKYFSRLNPTPLPCTGLGPVTWQELAPNNEAATGAPNTSWPKTCLGQTLSTVVKPDSPGDDRLIETVEATAGSIGYAALPDAKEVSGDFNILLLQSNGWKPAAEATFADPASGGQANCAAARYAVPTAGQRASGGGVNVDWSQVSGTRPGIGGASYPLCMLTYDLALRGYGTAGYTFKAYKTVRDYLTTYVVVAGQAGLADSGQYYATLPTSLASQYDVLAAARLAAGKISY